MNVEFMKDLAELLKKHNTELYVNKVNYQDGARMELGYKHYAQCGFYRKEKTIPLRTHMNRVSFTGFDAQMSVDQYNGVYL